MHTDTLIVGQGICGTWLSYWLQKAGADYLVIDDNKPNSASRVASGIINPVTGRRMVKTWMADELLPFARQSYSEFGTLLGQEVIADVTVVDFFSAPDRRLSFEKRSQEFESYLEWPQNENEWRHLFEYPFGFGLINPVYQADLQSLLSLWRKKLSDHNRLINERYESSALGLNNNRVEYKGITANRIVFCEGTAVMDERFFKLLPFAFNKGEALIIDAPELPRNYLFKKTSTITPWQNGLFWVGSSYDREYADDRPTEAFFNQTTGWLKQFLKVPFSVEHHLAAIRPTTVERRPFAGFHPNYPAVGILNGMGTKGVSLTPYIAHQLCQQILYGNPIIKEADVTQYAKILSRN